MDMKVYYMIIQSILRKIMMYDLYDIINYFLIHLYFFILNYYEDVGGPKSFDCHSHVSTPAAASGQFRLFLREIAIQDQGLPIFRRGPLLYRPRPGEFQPVIQPRWPGRVPCSCFAGPATALQNTPPSSRQPASKAHKRP